MFGPLVHDAARLLRKRIELRGRDLGLSSAQWRLLIRLLREGPATQARLADTLEVEPISVSRLVDRMVAAGWVERRKDPNDRRVHIVVPTERALAARGAIRRMADEVYAEATVGLRADARRQMIASLRLIVDNLSKCDDTAGKAPAHEAER